MFDWLEEQYEDYLVAWEAWGREFVEKKLTLDEFGALNNELEEISIDEDCGNLTKPQRQRREEIERLVLTHESYFADGPRVVITHEQRLANNQEED